MAESLKDRLAQKKASHSETEMKLNSAIAAVFNSPAGELVLNWLDQVTIRTILPPEATDAQLRYQEGMRCIVGQIKQRLERAEHDRQR